MIYITFCRYIINPIQQKRFSTNYIKDLLGYYKLAPSNNDNYVQKRLYFQNTFSVANMDFYSFFFKEIEALKMHTVPCVIVAGG